MRISYYTDGVEMPDINQPIINKWIEKIADYYGKKCGEIAYIFCNDSKIIEVNRQYLQHDYYTDIITFDYTHGSRISGDLFISLDTVESNSVEQNTTYESELHRVIIHGVLHLIGFDDLTDEEEKEMREKEEEALKLLFS